MFFHCFIYLTYFVENGKKKSLGVLVTFTDACLLRTFKEDSVCQHDNCFMAGLPVYELVSVPYSSAVVLILSYWFSFSIGLSLC